MKIRTFARMTGMALLLLFVAFAAWPQDEPVEGTDDQALEAPADQQPPDQEEQQAEEPEAQQAPAIPQRPAVPPPMPRPIPQRAPMARPSMPSRITTPMQPGQGNVQPANEFRPKDGQTISDDSAFNFENADLLTVVKSVAAMTGKNFDIDPGVASAAPVTLITYSKIPPDLAYSVLESILASRGYALEQTLDGHLTKIVPVGNLIDKRPLLTGKGELPPGFDTFSTYVVPVQYADATEVSNLLKNVGSQQSRVDVYAKTNTIILSDTADGIKKMLTLLEALDVPGYDTKMEIFTLEYTRAEVLSDQIDQVLMGGESASGPTPPRPVPTRAVRPSALAQAQSTVVGSREEVLRMVPDERLNSLIVVATEGLMDQVRELIAKLDTPTPSDANNMHIYPLLNANAEDVETTLNALTSGTTTRRSGAAAPSGGGIAGGGGGGAGSDQLQPFERSVLITRFDQTNSLLIVASPQDYKLIKQVIAQLDLPMRQVHVEAMVMEVSITDNFNLKVESTALTGNNFVGVNNVVQLANVLANGPIAGASGLGATLGYIDGTTDITMPAGVDAQGNVTAATKVTIPNVPLLITALEKLTDLDVLSKPSLTTVDNEEANIIVGQEVPVVTQTAATNNTYTGAAQVQRVDVGVKMKVTPQINEGDYVAMNVEVEVSQPVVSSVGIDPNQVGATFQKGQVTNRVVIKDGSTGIIGGLISESRDHTINQPPVLGDLPLVGWLFRAKSTSRTKRNLIVLLTPNIVKEGMDLDRQTRAGLDEFSNANIDALFEKGFIKKLKRKHELREVHSPSASALESLQESGYSRGNMQR